MIHQNRNGKKFNLGLRFGNGRKKILEHIEPVYVTITSVFDKEPQELQDNRE